MNASPSKIRAFSLIELIAVILIIGIIAAFTLPAASTLLRGSQLTQASQIIVDQFSLARQTALTKNRSVEVRLIIYSDPEVPSDTGNYRAIQVMEITESGVALPLDKPQLLPQSIVMRSSNLSSLITEAKATPNVPTKVLPAELSANDPELPRGVKKTYGYVAFRFLPDGSTNLPAKSSASADANGTWFVTLHNMNEKTTGTTPPANFFTLQIDPLTGKTKQYRPSV